MRNKLKNIYLNLPFCSKKCIYCDYPTYKINKNSNFLNIENKYIFFLQKEIEIFKNNYKEQISDNLETIYIGGGTPSIIDPKNIENLLNKFLITDKTEITIEVEPEDIIEELIIDYKKIGINRISLGIQSFHNPSLKFLKRNYNKNLIDNSLKILLKYFPRENINVDLLIGIPKESFEIYKNNLEKILFHKIGHITLNILSLEKKTELYKLSKTKKLMRNNNYLKKIYNYTQDYLKTKNYTQYDLISFAKKNDKSDKNIDFNIKSIKTLENINGLNKNSEYIKEQNKNDKNNLNKDDKNNLNKDNKNNINKIVKNYQNNKNDINPKHNKNDININNNNKNDINIINNKKNIKNKISLENIKKSNHNSIYMEGDINYIAFGLGASSLINNKIFKRPTNIKNYYKFVSEFYDSPEIILFKGENEIKCLRDILKVLFISNLMKIEGIYLEKILFYFQKFGKKSEFKGFLKDLEKFCEKEKFSLEIEGGFFRLKEKEILNLDFFLEEIFDIINNLE